MTCIVAVDLERETSADLERFRRKMLAYLSHADLTAGEGRIIPQWMASAVVKRGMKDERMEVIEILYGAAALADLPPTKAVQVELDVPHRTASDWIAKARAAGRLKGMNYTQGRPRRMDDA